LRLAATMRALKNIYIALVILYIGMIAAWCIRYPLSYEIVGVKPDLIEERSLTHQEYKILEKAVKIRQWSSKGLLYASLITAATSFVFLRKYWFEPVIIIKIVMIVAALIALILILVNGVHFVPGPPIR
jgi:hypothetical protein